MVQRLPIHGEGYRVSISALIQALPSEQQAATEFVAKLLEIPKVEEVIYVAPLGIGENDEMRVMALKLAIPGFRFIEDPRVSSPSNQLNVAAEYATSEVLLIVERLVEHVDVVDSSAFSRAVEDIGEKILEIPLYDPARSTRQVVPPLRFGVDATSFGRVYCLNRRYFLELRGFDERQEFSNFLGVDLLLRHLRLGGKVDEAGFINGFVAPTPFSNIAEAEIEKLKNDGSVFRNLVYWTVEKSQRVPLVTVAIATKDRENLLSECIDSIMMQTFQDFEVVIVDDGSTAADAVREVVSQYGDQRIRLLREEVSQGVARARNIAARNTRTRFTAVHDDDDLMLPYRLEEGLGSIGGDCLATYGGWINFHDETGELQAFATKKNFGPAMLAEFRGAPGHSTWTLPTRLIQLFKYDERLTASVDHELASRLMNAGLKWKHTGKYMYLRRVHELQITSQDGSNQKAGHNLSLMNNRFMCTEASYKQLIEDGKKIGWPGGMGKDNLFAQFGFYLPDKLVRRNLIFHGDSIPASVSADIPARVAELLVERNAITDKPVFESGYIRGVTLRELGELREKEITSYKVEAIRPESDKLVAEVARSEIDESNLDSIFASHMDDRIKHLRKIYPQSKVVVTEVDPDEYQTTQSTLRPVNNILDARKLLVAGEFGKSRMCVLLVFEKAVSDTEVLHTCRGLFRRAGFLRDKDSLASTAMGTTRPLVSDKEGF